MALPDVFGKKMCAFVLYLILFSGLIICLFTSHDSGLTCLNVLMLETERRREREGEGERKREGGRERGERVCE